MSVVILILKIQAFEAVRADLASALWRTFGGNQDYFASLVHWFDNLHSHGWRALSLYSAACEHWLPAHVGLHIFILNFSVFLSDFMVKVVEVSDSSQQKTLRGHEAPVLSVTFDPKDDFLVGKPFSLDVKCFSLSLFEMIPGVLLQFVLKYNYFSD